MSGRERGSSRGVRRGGNRGPEDPPRRSGRGKRSKVDDAEFQREFFLNYTPQGELDHDYVDKKVPPLVRKVAGNLLLGPKIGTTPVKSVVQCLARDPETDKFYLVKMLTSSGPANPDPVNDIFEEGHGKMLLANECRILTHLKGQAGVIQCHGVFHELCYQEVKTALNHNKYTGRIVKRYVMVLDCLVRHDYDPLSHNFVTLQHHVLREKKLSEKATLEIFVKIVHIVASLHEKDVVHRDLKLGNIILNLRDKTVTITNFCLGKIVTGDEICNDQRGSPAYVSPEVLYGEPYFPKPSDMWALGVILFTMLYGQFPFYDPQPQELFRRIKSAQYDLPKIEGISLDIQNVISKLLQVNPKQRYAAEELLECLGDIIKKTKGPTDNSEQFQVVPVRKMEEKSKKRGTVLSDTNLLVFDMFQFRPERHDNSSVLSAQEKLLNPHGHIKVTRVMEDGRPLTSDEYRELGPLIRQQKPSNVSSTGQPLDQPVEERKRSVSPILFSARSEILDSFRERARNSLDSQAAPPAPTYPVADLVPAVGDDESVLDLSTGDSALTWTTASQPSVPVPQKRFKPSHPNTQDLSQLPATTSSSGSRGKRAVKRDKHLRTVSQSDQQESATLARTSQGQAVPTPSHQSHPDLPRTNPVGNQPAVIQSSNLKNLGKMSPQLSATITSTAAASSSIANIPCSNRLRTSSSSKTHSQIEKPARKSNKLSSVMVRRLQGPLPPSPLTKSSTITSTKTRPSATATASAVASASPTESSIAQRSETASQAARMSSTSKTSGSATNLLSATASSTARPASTVSSGKSLLIARAASAARASLPSRPSAATSSTARVLSISKASSIARESSISKSSSTTTSAARVLSVAKLSPRAKARARASSIARRAASTITSAGAARISPSSRATVSTTKPSVTGQTATSSPSTIPVETLSNAEEVGTSRTFSVREALLQLDPHSVWQSDQIRAKSKEGNAPSQN